MQSPRSLPDLLLSIERALEEDGDRKQRCAACRTTAEGLGAKLPLVHRTGKLGAGSWKAIVREGVLRAGDAGTELERALGYERAVYFFLGCAAYPAGTVAFLLDAAALPAGSTFTPFDSGSLEKGFAVPADATRWATWDPASQRSVFEEHLGAGSDAPAFAASYVTAHFRAPLDYVRRPQQSVPDYPPYHGLRSTSGDRRAWSIEVRIHEDVDISSAGALAGIVLERHQMLAHLPDHVAAEVTVAGEEEDMTGEVVRRILARAQGGEGS